MRYSFLRGDTPVHRLNEVLKAACLVCIALIGFFIYSALVQLSIALLLLIVAVFFARIPANRLWRSMGYFAVLCTSYFFIQLLLAPGSNVLWQYGIVRVTWESLETATESAFAMFNVILASLIFVVTTDPKRLSIGLDQGLRFPVTLAYLVFLGLRFLPLTEDVLRNIKEAQMIRGVGEHSRGLRAKVRDVKRYTVPLLATSLQRGRVTSWSMESKGFRAFPRRTYLQQVDFPVYAKLAAAVVVALALLLVGSFFLGWRPASIFTVYNLR